MRDYEVENVKFKHELKPTNENPFVKLNEEALKLAVKKEDKIVRKTKRKIYDDPLSLGISGSSRVKNEDSSSKKLNEVNLALSASNNASKVEVGKANENNANANGNADSSSNEEISNTNSQSFLFSDTFALSDSIEDNWTLLKKNLINHFCTDKDLVVKSLFAVSMDDDYLQSNYKIDKGRSRLEELEKESKGEFNFTTSKEYVQKLEQLKAEMISKWNDNDRVGAIKIMIHCTKILNDISTPKFYCHKFIIITEILEAFADLVFKRIFKFAFPFEKTADGIIISSSNITNQAKDICSNWIYKCSCIRELLPRIYIDIIFIKIMKFMKTEIEIEQSMLNIARKIAGISHPLISFYLSAFFCKVVMSLYPNSKNFIIFLLELLSKYKLDSSLIKKYEYENITIEEFTRFIEPTYEWLMFCLSKSANEVSELL